MRTGGGLILVLCTLILVALLVAQEVGVQLAGLIGQVPS